MILFNWLPSSSISVSQLLSLKTVFDPGYPGLMSKSGRNIDWICFMTKRHRFHLHLNKGGNDLIKRRTNGVHLSQYCPCQHVCRSLGVCTSPLTVPSIWKLSIPIGKMPPDMSSRYFQLQQKGCQCFTDLKRKLWRTTVSLYSSTLHLRSTVLQGELHRRGNTRANFIHLQTQNNTSRNCSNKAGKVLIRY